MIKTANLNQFLLKILFRWSQSWSKNHKMHNDLQKPITPKIKWIKTVTLTIRKYTKEDKTKQSREEEEGEKTITTTSAMMANQNLISHRGNLFSLLHLFFAFDYFVWFLCSKCFTVVFWFVYHMFFFSVYIHRFLFVFCVLMEFIFGFVISYFASTWNVFLKEKKKRNRTRWNLIIYE